MRVSLAPILLTVELGAAFMLAWRCGRLSGVSPGMRPVHLYLLWLTAYCILSSVLGARGLYTSDALLRTFPGFWLPALLIVIAVPPIVLFGSVRAGLRRMVDTTPWHWFVYFHALRIGALGTAYRTAIGDAAP